uniref:F-box domain-containing protein n=1 Tax=Caenorhabditis tropicalis TaxID=1561998 RepID=A0A1I7U2Y0_9PELO
MANMELVDMPLDIINMVITHLELRDRLRLRNVSRRFREVVDATPFEFEFIQIYRDDNMIIFTYPGFALGYTGVRHCTIWIGDGGRLRRHRRTPTQVALEYFCRLLSPRSTSINALEIHVRGEDNERFLIDLLLCMQTIEWQRRGPIDVRTVSLQARTLSPAMKWMNASRKLGGNCRVETAPTVSFFGGGITGLANSNILSFLADIFVCAVISSQDAVDILHRLLQNANFHKMELILDFDSIFNVAEFARLLDVPMVIPFQLHHRLQIPNSDEDIIITFDQRVLVYEKIARQHEQI